MSEAGGPDQSEINSEQLQQPQETEEYNEQAFKKDAKEHGIRYARIRAENIHRQKQLTPEQNERLRAELRKGRLVDTLARLAERPRKALERGKDFVGTFTKYVRASKSGSNPQESATPPTQQPPSTPTK